MRAAFLPAALFLCVQSASAQTVRRIPVRPAGMDLRIGAIGSALPLTLPAGPLALQALKTSIPSLAAPLIKPAVAAPRAALSLHSAAEDIRGLGEAKASPSRERSSAGRAFDNTAAVSHNAQAVGLEGVKPMPEPEWKGAIRALIYPVQFSADPKAEVGRVLGLVAKGPKYSGKDKKELLAAIERALADPSDLSKLIPQDHPEPVLRAYLEALAVGLRGSN